MVRSAVETPTMENREEILDALNDFSRKQPKEIPPLLDQFLKQVAKTGETIFPWTLLKALFVTKLEQVMHDFNEECINDEQPPCPNVENARFEVYRARIMEAVHKFHGAPFTIQRLCELLTDPKRHYKRCDKFMRGLEKNVLVVSTVDPFGRKVVSESKNLVNGMDSNNSSSEDSSALATSSSLTSTTPPVPSWPSSSSSLTTSWPVQADLITPSTAPLLEVCDLPDPREPPSTTSNTAIPSTEVPVNGHEPGPSGSGSVAIATSSSTVSGTPSADLSVVTSMEETVDSSDQQVAAEEMVGVEEETAVSTGMSQEAAGMVEETVVETPLVAAEVMKETTDVRGADGELTTPASGDWLANISEPADSEPTTTESEKDGGMESLKKPDAESGDVPERESEDSSAAEAKDSSCTDSPDGLETQANSISSSQPCEREGESAITLVGTSDAELAKEENSADSSLQPESGDSEDQALSVKEQDGEPLQDKKGEECTSANSVETDVDSRTVADNADESKERTDANTPVLSDSIVSNSSSVTYMTSEEQLPSESSVSSSDNNEANTTQMSSPVSTSEQSPPPPCLPATSDAEAINSSASNDEVVGRAVTTTSSSPMGSSAPCAEGKSEDATCMETDSADSSNSVPKAAESRQPEGATSSSESTEVQQEAPSTDPTPAEPMEQD